MRETNDKTVQNEFLFRKPLQKTVTARGLFKLVNKFFNEHNKDLSLIAAICGNGGPATLEIVRALLLY